MSTSPLISVVMSVYNNEDFLPQAIKSIVSQSYSNFEFIIVNDGSTDSSKHIIIEWQKTDDRIIFIDRKSNKGLPYSLNESIAIAKGKYVARMDSDDVAIRDRFEKQVGFLEGKPEVDIVGGQVTHIDSKGSVLKSSKQPLSFEEIKLIAEFACPVNHPTYMVKKNAYVKLEGYRDVFIYAQDYDFILRAIDCNLIIENMPDILLQYRSSTSERSTIKIHRQLYLGRQAIKLHKERVKFRLESVKTFKKSKRTMFYAEILFSFSWNLRGKVLEMEIPRLATYIFAFFLSLLHYEVFYDSLRGMRLKFRK